MARPSATPAMSRSPPSISSTPMTTRPPRTSALMGSLLRRLRGGGVGRDDHRGAIRDDLGHRAGEPAGVEAHRDDRIRPHQGRVLDESVERLAAGVLEQLGVLVNLAPGEGPKAGDEVPGEASRSHDEPEGLALRLDHAVAGDERCGGDEHGSDLLRDSMPWSGGARATQRVLGARAAFTQEGERVVAGLMAVAPG